MLSFVFPEKYSLSGRIGSHNHVAEIYSISANAVICVFASMILNSSAEIATLCVTYVYDGPVFVGELIYARLSRHAPYSFRVAKSVPSIYYRHNTSLIRSFSSGVISPISASLCLMIGESSLLVLTIL